MYLSNRPRQLFFVNGVNGEYEAFHDVDYIHIQNPLLLQKDRQALPQIDERNEMSYKSVFNVTLFKHDKVLKELYVSNVVTNFLDNLMPSSLFGEEHNTSLLQKILSLCSFIFVLVVVMMTMIVSVPMGFFYKW